MSALGRRIAWPLILATSLGLNGWLLLTRSSGSTPQLPAPRGPVAEPPSAEKPDASGEQTGSASAQDLLACQRKLAASERKRWQIAVRAMRLLPLAPRTPTAASPARPAARRPAQTSDPSAQQSALCTVAKEHLRREWAGQREKLVSSLRKSLADADKQRADADKEVSDYARKLQLSPADRERLATHYPKLRLARIAKVHAALSEATPDWSIVLSEARGLIADQDRIVRELFGSPAVARLRHSELKGRTVILALIAAQADLPWDQNIAW